MSQTLKRAIQTYQQGDFPSALALAQRLISAEQVHTQDIYALLGNTLAKLGKFSDAGDAFVDAARFDTEKSGALIRSAIEHYAGIGAKQKILVVGERAIALNPGDAAIAFHYVDALCDAGRPADAVPHLGALDRGDGAHRALAVQCLVAAGDQERLSHELAIACRAAPHDMALQTLRFVTARDLCDFDALAELATWMAALDKPAAAARLAAEPALSRLLWNDSEEIDRRQSADSMRAAAMPVAQARRPFSAEGERIRIGYLSNDFYDHATMRLFGQVLALHDRDAFDVSLFCYTDERHLAWQRQHLPCQAAKAVVPVRGLSDAEAAAAIAGRRIDILVDLKGHSANARTGIVNLSDAPVKVSYLGFAGSVHGADLDYAITDRFVTPETSKPFYSERLCRLPESFQANDFASRPLPQAARRADWGLPADAVVFASFNATRKITRRTLALWSRVLKRVPGSFFWILCENPLARRNLLAGFAAEGVGAERIVFAGIVPYADHLARLPLADLGLDTFPCNGHTSTSDMLWSGLPLLSGRGRNYNSRVSESLLNGIGLAELVAADDDAFCDMATALARAPGKIAELKQRLEENRFCAPLFNGQRITAHLERAYTMMADRARAGLAPDHIDVPALPAREGPFASRRRGG